VVLDLADAYIVAIDELVVVLGIPLRKDQRHFGWRISPARVSGVAMWRPSGSI